MDLQTTIYLMVGLSFALYIGIAIWARAGTTSEFYSAGGAVHPVLNGMATGADWMSAASFIGMAGRAPASLSVWACVSAISSASGACSSFVLKSTVCPLFKIPCGRFGARCAAASPCPCLFPRIAQGDFSRKAQGVELDPQDQPPHLVMKPASRASGGRPQSCAV